jgi:TetR/AcrR family transcriptional regulator, ethionamide resistance regulator
MNATPGRARYKPGPRVGDQRRAALLAALEQLLTTRPLAQIAIGDITRDAGLSRSSFYFYFPTKGAAVGALLADFQAEMQKAAVSWYDGGPGTPLERTQAGLSATLELWRSHGRLLVALLDATGTDPELREIWDAWNQGFIQRVADRIVQDRNTGLARGTADPHALATALLGASIFTVEQDLRAILAGQDPSDTILTALVELWHRTLYQSD